MKTKDLAYLLCHNQGCHAVTAFFSSPTVGEKSKDKLIQSLKVSAYITLDTCFYYHQMLKLF